MISNKLRSFNKTHCFNINYFDNDRYQILFLSKIWSSIHSFHKLTLLQSLLATLLIVQRIASQPAQPNPAAGVQTTPIPIIKYENPGVGHDGSYKWR